MDVIRQQLVPLEQQIMASDGETRHNVRCELDKYFPGTLHNHLDHDDHPKKETVDTRDKNIQH